MEKKHVRFSWFALSLDCRVKPGMTGNRLKEGLQNPCGKPAPASGMQRKADFAVNSGAIDRKSQRSDAPSGGMRAAQRVLHTFLK
ncbi:hypothetical protein [Lampropedia hyalina]|jgi:hypothetical protein|uniref:hypothetical protein n=1 Tax=Lampropedia hyalina TaxID=198706 RepID=UPI0009341970|nr:hypothetical protein [Lampropedia hyalina]